MAINYGRYYSSEKVEAFKKNVFSCNDLNMNNAFIFGDNDLIDKKRSKKSQFGLCRVDNDHLLLKNGAISRYDKSSNNFHSKNFDFSEYHNRFLESGKKLTEIVASPSLNNSTLSLHIEAYENSIEPEIANKSLGISNSRTGKAIKGAGQCLVGPVFHNLFEFPRQQKDQTSEPEIMQFKASQTLLNPNELNPIIDNNEPLEKMFEKITFGLGKPLDVVKEQLSGSIIQNPFGNVPAQKNVSTVTGNFLENDMQPTASQQMLELFKKLTIKDGVVDKKMERNAKLYKDGCYHLKLNVAKRRDSEELSLVYAQFCVAFSHLIFWKYSKHKFPPGLFIHKIWYFDAEDDIPQRYWHCLDKFVAKYIDRHLQALKRWIQRQQIEEMQIMFLNKEKKIAVSHCILFPEAVEGGLAKKILGLKSQVRELKKDLGDYLHHFEHSHTFDIAANYLHEFKISFKFQKNIGKKNRDGEHVWIQTACYKPMSSRRKIRGGHDKELDLGSGSEESEAEESETDESEAEENEAEEIEENEAEESEDEESEAEESEDEEIEESEAEAKEEEKEEENEGENEEENEGENEEEDEEAEKVDEICKLQIRSRHCIPRDKKFF